MTANRLIRLAAAVALFALASGAAHAQKADELEIWFSENYARYGKLARQLEAIAADRGSMPIETLPVLCLAYSKLKNYRKLFPCIDELEVRVQRGTAIAKSAAWFLGGTDFRPFPLMLLAETELELGEFARSVETGRRALERVSDEYTFGAYHPTRYRINILANLAMASLQAGERAAAIAYQEQLAGVAIPLGGGVIYAGWRDNGLARIAFALGDCKTALDHLQEGPGSILGAIGNVFLRDEGDTMDTTVELQKLLIRSRCLIELERPEEASSALDRLLAHQRAPEQGEVYWLALFQRGRAAEALRDPQAAIGFYRRAIEVIEEQRSTLQTESNKIGFAGDKQDAYARCIAALLTQGRASEAFEYVERSKARALVDLLGTRTEFAAAPADDGKVRKLLAELKDAEAAAQVRDESVQPGENAGRRSLQLLRREIQSVAPEISSLVAVSSAVPAELQVLLGKDETLVEYWYHGKSLYAFVVTRTSINAVPLDGTTLLEDVQAFRRALEEPASSAWEAPAQALHVKLWSPVQPLLTGKRIVVVAHGALHYVPFAALRAPDGSLLIERASLRFLPSASVLKFFRPPSNEKRATLLAIGNPDLGDPGMDLKFAEQEAREVAGLFPESRLLVRKEASETSFRRAGALFRQLHFATHGKFSADQPLNSGLFLAKDEQNDGVLTVGELYGMRLEADLVILSACETGLGKVASGDDVVGLTRGFLYAGSRSIVASLWSVDDRATSLLMRNFYGGLAQASKEEALRKAQLSVRAELPHPFFWAAFQLTGQAD